MSNNVLPNNVYTPEQVASMLQLSKNTVYDLISHGKLVAKRFGRVYRIPASSISFMFNGLDVDLYEAEQTDSISLIQIHKELLAVRKER
jgi:excisionase family DNA binding protein